MALSKKFVKWLMAAGAVVALSACSGSGDSPPAAELSAEPTEVPTAPTEAAETTAVPTTAAPTTSAAPAPTLAPTTTAAPVTTVPRPLDGGAGELGIVLASADTASAESMRAEMFMVMAFDDGFESFELGTLDEPIMLMVAESADRGFMSMDLGVMFPPELGPVPFDPSMEFVIDGTQMYVRGGMFAELAGELGGEFDTFSSLDESWGYINLGAFEALLPEDIAAAFGQQGLGVWGYFDVLQTISSVSEGAPSEVRGIPTTNYLVETSFGDWIQQTSGLDLEQFSAALGPVVGTDDELTDAVLAAMFDLPLVFAVDIDDEGRLRRMDLYLDMGPLVDSVGELLDEEVPSDLTFEMTVRIDIVEYDPAITVDVPTDAVDVTDAFWSLLAEEG